MSQTSTGNIPWDWAPLAGKPMEKPIECSKAAFVIEMVSSLEKCVDFI